MAEVEKLMFQKKHINNCLKKLIMTHVKCDFKTCLSSFTLFPQKNRDHKIEMDENMRCECSI